MFFLGFSSKSVLNTAVLLASVVCALHRVITFDGVVDIWSFGNESSHVYSITHPHVSGDHLVVLIAMLYSIVWSRMIKRNNSEIKEIGLSGYS